MTDGDFLRRIFLMEAWDTVTTVEQGLPALAEAEPTALVAAVEPLLVVTHRLRGTAALQGFVRLGELAGVMEQTLEGMTDGDAEECQRRIDDVRGVLPIVKQCLEAIAAGGDDALAVAGEPSARPVHRGWPARATDAETAELLGYFAIEAAEHVETMTRSLLALERRRDDAEELAHLFRAVHTLKGAAYTMSATAVGDVAHRIEDLLVAVREGRVAFTPAVVEVGFAGVDAIKLLLNPDGDASELAEALRRLTDGIAAATQPADAAESEETPAATALTGLVPLPPPAPPARVPIGTRRVATTAAAPAQPTIRVGLDRLEGLMNLVGELVIARSRLDRRVVQLDRLGEVLLWSRTRMVQAVRDFEAKHAAAPLPSAAAADGAERFGELEFDRYDDFTLLARSLGEIAADVSEAQAQLALLIGAVTEDSVQIQRLTGDLRGQVTRTRMVPIGRVFGRFARQVRETARAEGKSVELVVLGESTEVDNTIAERLADPLLHLVRNAVAHGIETEAERVRVGKPGTGTVYLNAYQQGGFIHVEVEDDGAGMDVERLRARGLELGFVSPAEAPLLSTREVLDLIFLPGFTTARAITATSGRGVGMDVVRADVGRLNGEVEVETEPGVGTRFTLRLPQTLVISNALFLRVDADTLALPLNAVKSLQAVAPDAVRAMGEAEFVPVEDQFMDLVRLPPLLGLPRAERPGLLPVVVLRAGGRAFGLAVEELVGKEEIVIKSLGAFLDGIGPFAGATIAGDGRVVLLLDPARLLEMAETGRRPEHRPTEGAAAPRAAGKGGRRVLLVDDSVSVRKFLGRMLEKAGFIVVTASDGVDALQNLADTGADVVVTDLEMPRMNGYELIENLRADPATRELPVVILTTRAGEKHASVARGLGIRHYVPKPVDEHAFVRLLESLVPGASRR